MSLSFDTKKILTEYEAENSTIIMKSRADLSKTRTPLEVKTTVKAPGNFGNKGYFLVQ
jgi:hypothetical protein